MRRAHRFQAQNCSAPMKCCHVRQEAGAGCCSASVTLPCRVAQPVPHLPAASSTTSRGQPHAGSVHTACQPRKAPPRLTPELPTLLLPPGQAATAITFTGCCSLYHHHPLCQPPLPSPLPIPSQSFPWSTPFPCLARRQRHALLDSFSR
ncbi:hypothetical protein GUJ93_ZPchr0010g10089 [Zizania palustris]|uniref:Uncharacterized protein n=1 Tax=Zizania palustris TaxID=103762 RepID=A0A8J6BJN4_ZIZPA|nr:hypothetical protein GUJ93_ZPchr0010g10089 [Zizania palustris]